MRIRIGNGLLPLSPLAILPAAFILTVASTLVSAGYAITKPEIADTFTEFYILGIEDVTSHYPAELMVSEERKLALGVAKH